MSHSQAVSTRDVIRVMRLVRETCELGDDAVQWRRHFIEGLRNLVDKGMYGIAAVLRQPVVPTNFDIPLQFWVGLDAQRVQIWDRYVMGHDVSPDPNTPAILAFGASDFTRRREQLCTDRQWYGSDYFNEIRRPMGVDDMLFTHVMPPGMHYATAFALCRELDSRPFDRRDTAIVHFAHMELRKVWRSGAGALRHLGQRQREVLELVCQGLSEKEMARALSLSPRTVHNYITILHNKLSAHSRGELVRAGIRMLRTRGPRVLPH